MPSNSPQRTENEEKAVYWSLWLLRIVFVVLAYFTLRYVAHLLVPVLVAMAIAYFLDPAVQWLTKQGVGRTWAALGLLASFLVGIVVLLSIVIPLAFAELRFLVNDLPRLGANFLGWIETTFHIQVPTEWQALLQADRLTGLLKDASGPLGRVATAAVASLISLISVVTELLLIPVFAYYFLVSYPDLKQTALGMIPPRRRGLVVDIASQIDGVLGGWVRGQAIVTTSLMALYAVGFWLVGMPMAWPVGLLVGLLSIVPFVGAVIGALITIAVVIANGGDWSMLAGVSAVLVSLHVLEASILTPKITGHSVGLGEAAALFAVVAGGKLLGFVGVLLAVPLAATIGVLVRHLVKAYRQSEFYGDEQDAHVVLPPAAEALRVGGTASEE